MNFKKWVERPLCFWPQLHAAVLRQRPNPDINKIAWIGLVRRGQMVLDGGANRGVYTEFFARKVGNEGCIFAFEPVLRTYELLLSRCRMLRNVVPVAAGLADHVGKATIMVPDDDFQQASLSVQSVGSWEVASGIRRFPVNLTTLDYWGEENRLEDSISSR